MTTYEDGGGDDGDGREGEEHELLQVIVSLPLAQWHHCSPATVWRGGIGVIIAGVVYYFHGRSRQIRLAAS